MRSDDDTVRQGNQASEDALLAQVEAGLMPGVLALGSDPTPEEVARAKEAAESGEALVFYRVTRALAEEGAPAGATCGDLLLGLPVQTRGAVILTFDGWADDPRPLCTVPTVVDYCRGMLLGPTPRAAPDLARAKAVLECLLDEDPIAWRDGVLVNEAALGAAGALWLVAHAFPARVFAHRPGGFGRDYTMNFRLREWLAGRQPPPLTP